MVGTAAPPPPTLSNATTTETIAKGANARIRRFMASLI
jgi:hypothetical protein